MPRAAEAIGLSYFQFRKFVNDGTIPYYRYGSAKLFKLSEIVASINSKRVASTDEVLQ